MEKVKLSIIVPVYNVEKYLKLCIESILQQNLEQYEIILIDDGSKDNSGKICDEYSKKYFNISVIHKENGGLSDARNCGIAKAKGEYLMFIDSDDFINNEVNLKELYKYLKYDIIQYKMLYFYEDINKKMYLKDLNQNNNKDFIEEIKNKIKTGELSISACDKIVRKKIVLDNNLFFEKGLLSEDIDWSLRLYLIAKSIHTINLNIYVYRQNREGSITGLSNNNTILSLYKIIKRWTNYNYNSEELKTIYFNYLAYQYIILITIINKKNCDKELKRQIYKYKFLLKYRENYKVKMSNKVIKLLGTNIGVKILKIYLKLKNRGILKI